MAIISANLQFNRGGHGLLDYSSLQTNYSTALAWAQDANSNAAVGQFIYLENAETIEGVEYAKGPYVVDAIGEGAVLTPLSKSVAGNPDLASLVSNLQGEVGTLKTGLATTDSSVKKLETTVAAIPTTYATKAEVEEAIGNVDFFALATKEELNNGLGTKADASTVYTKDEADGKYVAKEGYVTYTQEEKEKLASLANIKSVGNNLSIVEGELQVSIPEVEVPFQSVAEGDKVLKLENGVLSSTLSYVREAVEGVDSLVLKGIDGNVIGSVPVADFVADGMLESVTPVEGTNKFKFTFKKVDGSTEDFEVDFGKFVDVYKGDDATIELDSTTNTFSVKANVFETYGEASKAESAAKSYADGLVAEVNAEVAKKLDITTFDSYKTDNDAAVAAKVEQSEYNAKVADIDSSITSIKADVTNGLALKADASNVYTKSDIDASINAAIATAIEPLATSEELSNGLALKADASNVYTKSDIDASINAAIATLATKEYVDGSLNLKADASNVYTKDEVDTLLTDKVDKVDGKGLSTNDFTDELKTKLEGIEIGAEVNVVKSVATSDELKLSENGELSLNLSTFAKTSEVNNGLATKLDNTAKVNGVSFVNGEATIDGEDIALGVAITREGDAKPVYSDTLSIQSVLANLSHRIDVLDPNVSGELGITSIVEGNGVKVTTSGGQATISVKASEVEGNMAEVKTDGVYIADMRSYWEAI